MAPYAHVGRRVLFRENEMPAMFPEPVNGLDAGDLKRLKAILRGGAEPAANNSIEEKGLLRRIMAAGADRCRRFVDTHFFCLFFSSGDDAGWRPGAAGTARGKGNRQDFFFSGVSNAEGEILWGYGQWCSLLYPPK